jgi:hypothetical protein
MVALPAFAFQSVTASAHTRGDHPRLRERQKIPSVNFFINPPYLS